MMCNKTSILLLRLCYILICNKKEADVIKCYVAIQDFTKAQGSRLVETCAITVFRKLKVGPLNGILTTKSGPPPTSRLSSFLLLARLYSIFHLNQRLQKYFISCVYTAAPTTWGNIIHEYSSAALQNSYWENCFGDKWRYS